jgi:hypothetical protein
MGNCPDRAMRIAQSQGPKEGSSMRREIWCFATALAALLSTAAADATPIEYSFSGTGDWTLNGLGGSGDFVVNLTADTSKIVAGTDTYGVFVSGGTFSSGGSPVAFTESGPVVAANEVIDGTDPPGTMLFAQVPDSGPVTGLGLTNSLFETYDLSHALPLTSGTPEWVSTPFFTSDGPLEFLSISALSFQATIVPESSTWAMLLLGFAGLGCVGYRLSGRSAVLAA